MLEGLVQHDHPLTLQYVLGRMRTINGASQVVTARGDQLTRASYAEVGERVDRLGSALTRDLGVRPGERVATFMWNSQEHLEIYLGAPCTGAVLHTLNLRLFPEQLAYIVNHAEDRVIFVDGSLTGVLARVAGQFETVERYVLVGDGDADALPGEVVRYEELLAEQPGGFDWPELEDDRMAAGLCYTSGTTGNPKGVLYSHRSNILHALGSCMADSLGLSSRDRVLPVVPMFHANAWGLPYACAIVGADLIMPGPGLQAEPLARLIEEENVTVAGAVPTIWMDLLRYADEHKPDLSSLRMVLCGGSAVPEALMRAFEERHGVRIIQGWGMTETSPLGAVAHPPRDAEDEHAYRVLAGRVVPLVEARIVGDDGTQLPWDNEATGELQVRGPWIARAYYNAEPGDVKFTDDGWLKTGDVAAMTPDGFIRISDRAKDVIKSGGEWISSVDLENALMAHEDVEEAAVIAKPDERWAERPLACVVLREGASTGPRELCDHLTAHVAKWWIPDEFAFIEEVPKTSVGKFDKKVLRARLAEGRLDRVPVSRPEVASGQGG